MSETPHARLPATAPGYPAPLLKMEKMSRTYSTGETVVTALKDVDFELMRGELVVVLGPSGSGKSTFLNLMGALDRPTSGRLLFEGEDVFRLRNEQLTEFRRMHVGLVFQFYNLLPTLTALENVQIMESLSDRSMRSEDALRKLRMWERRNHFPSELSGGEQQRIAIARAIVKNPKLLLCDEPTGALDVQTGILVLEAIEQVHHDWGVSVVLITHNTSIALLADRIVHMSGGRIQRIETNSDHRLARDLQW